MGQRKLDLALRMHIIADLNKEKLNLHLSHPITVLFIEAVLHCPYSSLKLFLILVSSLAAPDPKKRV